MTFKQILLTAVCLGSFSAAGVIAGGYDKTGADARDRSQDSENLQAETRGEVRTNANTEWNEDESMSNEADDTAEVPASYQRDDAAADWQEDESEYNADQELESEATSDEINP